jgi:GWxTD domain-containing protein
LGSDPILYARYYKRDFPIAAPPFISTAPKPFDFTPDSVFVLQKQNQGSVLHLTRTGFYQVTDDTSHRPGCTIFSFGTYFPEAKTVLDLALPLRYITTNEEYDQIMSSEYLKKEVDAFWLKTGGNPQRARTLIQAFYERVQYANQYFTSYLEGWKTDRGMCYVIFGPPDVVHRSTATETWTYGADGSYSALSLTFTKVVNPFSNNDYRLNRSSSLKTPWYRAVEFWRQGRVLKYE